MQVVVIGNEIMVDALKKIRDTADRHRITLRTATFAVACERVLDARAERGLHLKSLEPFSVLSRQVSEVLRAADLQAIQNL